MTIQICMETKKQHNLVNNKEKRQRRRKTMDGAVPIWQDEHQRGSNDLPGGSWSFDEGLRVRK